MASSIFACTICYFCGVEDGKEKVVMYLRLEENYRKKIFAPTILSLPPSRFPSWDDVERKLFGDMLPSSSVWYENNNADNQNINKSDLLYKRNKAFAEWWFMCNLFTII